MGGIDFVVPIGADHQQLLHVRLGQQVGEHVERRRVEPLQIVEKERQRMSGRAKTPRNRRNTSWRRPCGLLRRKLLDRRLLSDEEFQFGTTSITSRPFGPSASPSAVAPAGQLGVALAQKRADQALKRLRQRRIGDVALVLVELAGDEKAARPALYPRNLRARARDPDLLPPSTASSPAPA